MRTPSWCREVTFRVNQEPAVKVDPQTQELGRYELNREWKEGDVIRISMPMEWRFVRGRGVQDGRVALLRGPIVYCIGKDQNADLFAKCPDPRSLVIDPTTIADPFRMRPFGHRACALPPRPG